MARKAKVTARQKTEAIADTTSLQHEAGVRIVQIMQALDGTASKKSEAELLKLAEEAHEYLSKAQRMLKAVKTKVRVDRGPLSIAGEVRKLERAACWREGRETGQFGKF